MPTASKARFSGCLDRNSVYREEHSWDKDMICVFCDETEKSSRIKIQRVTLADFRRSTERFKRGIVQRQARINADKLEQLIAAAEELGA
jgi:hypothetical protein